MTSLARCVFVGSLLAACSAPDAQAPHGPSGAGAGGGNGGSAAAAGSTSTNLGGGGSSGGSGGTIGLGGAGAAGQGGAGGAAGSAGAGGAAAGAGGQGGAASSCVTAGTELCEDFESGTLDLAKWTLAKPTDSASVVVDTTRPHAGNYSLHIQVAAGESSTAQIADAVTFPAASNTFYTRAYFYFSPDLPADDNGGYHMAFLLATGNNDLGFVEAGLGSAGNKQYLGYSEYYGAGPDVHQHGPTFTEFGPRSDLQVVPMTWICLELMQGGDATTTHRRVWVDGNELPEQQNDFSDRKPPAFSLMSIGVLQYHPTPILTDVWVDDIRVSKDPIGCE